MVISVDPEWWKTLFDEVYLLTDARSVCDAAVTGKEVDLVLALIPLLPHHRLLDLCGGHGRHVLELCSRGLEHCVLVDYSRVLVRRAKMESLSRRLPLSCLVADARRTGLLSRSFDRILIMGNSLGYLRDSEADLEILRECHRLLRSEGRLLVDLADGESVKKRFNPEAWHEIGEDILVCRRREMHERSVSVRELVVSKRKGLIRDRSYSIRFYEKKSAEKLLAGAGFEQIEITTDFSPHVEAGDHGFMDCRMIVVGRKP
ncbi:MAG: class I SAM-dependent methyltransferase [Deltaproteobacteria bacterium]|nr:class I SAM-dependent methyltransferase [Deltaproteobacteria bacterium]